MLFIAEVDIRVFPYMEDDYLITKNHTVEASSEEEAKEKIKAHYEAKCKGHGGDSYSVYSVIFFEHIS